MEVNSLGSLQPVLDLLMFVRRIVVNDDVKILTFGCLSLNLLQEGQELLMPMALFALTDDTAIAYIQCGK
jgi:hypothetical protein